MQDILALSVGGTSVLFVFVALISRKRGFQSVSEFFLAGKSNRSNLVVNMLLSGSFSLNGMLYQIYLGYKIGIYAILPQIAWMLSFFWLAKYAQDAANSDGLHAFLGTRFGQLTRRVAAFFSIAGLGLQVGWEYGVAKSAFSAFPLAGGATIVAFVVFTIFAVTTLYTLIGGLRSNAWSDTIQNVLKGGCFVVIGSLVWTVVAASAGMHFAWWQAVLPAPSVAIAELTISGLITNLMFSVVWQFVDMSCWETLASGKPDEDGRAAGSQLRWAGVWALVAPGALGTVIGILLRPHAGLGADTIMPTLISLAAGGPILTALLVIALVATVMSFVDGMLLAVAFTFIADVLFRRDVDKHHLLREPTKAQLEDLRYQRDTAKVKSYARVLLILVVVTATIVLERLSAAMHLDLFSQVYIVIICQLSLFGPVYASLRGRVPKSLVVGSIAIVAAAVAGFSVAIYGAVASLPDVTNVASVVTLALSFAIAWIFSATPSAAHPAASKA